MGGQGTGRSDASRGSGMRLLDTRRPRAQSACGSQRSNISSVILDAQGVLGKAGNVLNARPQTAKTTKTVLSHRNRNGWGSTLRDGDIVKHAGTRIPRRNGYDIEVDHSTGELRRRPVKA